jgi:hypothetical protein
VTPAERAELVTEAGCLRGRAAAWYQARLHVLQRVRDELVGLASDAHAAAQKGDIEATLQCVSKMGDATFDLDHSHIPEIAAGYWWERHGDRLEQILDEVGDERGEGDADG